MPVLGSIRHITGRLYQDMRTGRFVNYESVRSVLDEARFYGYQSQNLLGNLEKAYETMVKLSGLTPQEARARIGDYINRFRAWQDGGQEGDTPYLDSP